MRYKFAAVLALTGVLIGFLIISQIKTGIPKSSNFPLDQLEAKESLMKDFLGEQNNLKSNITSLREKIAKNEEKNPSYQQDLLDELKNELGLLSIKGSGVEIYLADSPRSDRDSTDINSGSLVRAADLRDIINVLYLSGIEGLSINDQRILHNSPVTAVGNSILVNNFHLLPPFTIKAIGDPLTLIARMSSAILLPDIFQRTNQSGIIFRVQRKDFIELPVYNGTFQFKFTNS